MLCCWKTRRSQSLAATYCRHPSSPLADDMGHVVLHSETDRQTYRQTDIHREPYRHRDRETKTDRQKHTERDRRPWQVYCIFHWKQMFESKIFFDNTIYFLPSQLARSGARESTKHRRSFFINVIWSNFPHVVSLIIRLMHGSSNRRSKAAHLNRTSKCLNCLYFPKWYAICNVFMIMMLLRKVMTMTYSLLGW